MKNLPLLLVAFALIDLVSCRREQEDLMSFPRYMVADYIKAKAAIRLFTDGKEITNQAIIDSFVKDSTRTWFGTYMKHNNVFGYDKRPITADTVITFTHPDSAVVGEFKYNSNYKRSVTRRGKELVIISPLYVIESYSSPVDEIVKHKLVIEDYISLPSRRRIYKVKEVYSAYGDYNQIEVPRISYFHKKRNEGNSLSILNEFDETYIAKVAKGDTLIVQEYLLGLKAK